MAVTSSLLFLLITSTIFCLSAATGSNDPAATNFIKSSCSATSYPTLCVESLSVYAGNIHRSRRQLALAALSVSLARAHDARDFVSGAAKKGGLSGRAYMAMRDCLEVMSDSVDRLSRSVQEMKSMGNQDLAWHVSNVETWVSAALTDENTCMDGLKEKGVSVTGRLRSAIRGKIVNVAQVTSNALALVNRFAEKH